MMNDETEQFERRLKRQPLRQVPSGWRDEILAATRESKAVHPASRIPHRSLLSTINHQLSTLLWPHPKAWAGLAAVWVLILGLNVSMREPGPALTKKMVPPSPEVMVELKQQHRLFAELIGGNEVRDADRPKMLPLPRSGRRFEIMAA